MPIDRAIVGALASAIPNTSVPRESSTVRSSVEASDPADLPPPGRRRVIHRDRAEIVRLYESGLSARVVAKQVGLSKATVLSVLRAEEITIRARGYPGWSRQ